MALKITKAADPIVINRLKTVIYGPPGVSKSSVAFTAAAPLTLDFDGGAYRAPNRKDIVQIRAWSDVESITAEDLAAYQTIIMDTAGRALDVLATDIIAANPKHGTGGALNQRGFGELKRRFIAFLNLLISFDKDVILIAHMDEQHKGDDVLERLDVQGGSKGELYKSADAMGRLVIENGSRYLKFSPTDAAFGKNPGQLEPLKVPLHTDKAFDGWLAGVIQQIKDKLNEQTEAQRVAAGEQEWFRANLPNAKTAEDVNGLIERAKAGGAVTSKLLADRAVELKLVFDKEAKAYVEKPKDPAAPPTDNKPATETAEPAKAA